MVFTRSPFLIGAVILAATFVHAQEEQSTASATSATARFWTAPRIQPEPTPGDISTAIPVTTTNAEPVSITNEFLIVTVQPNGTGLTITDKASGRAFITDGNFEANGGRPLKLGSMGTKFGPGDCIQISYPDGDDTVFLYPKVPFALIRSSVRNRATVPAVIQTARPFQATVSLGKPASALTTLGTGGLLAPNKNPGSYDWLAVADPETRNGVVFGWLTHDRGDGILFSKVEGNAIHVGGQIDYGRLRIKPGDSEGLEILAVGYFDDARLGLESWADQVAKNYDIHLPPQPVVFCTWYSQPYGGASDEKHLAEAAAFAEKNLKPFGFSVMQIDDHWQAGTKGDGPKRNFTTHDPEGPYPTGMKTPADNVKSHGLVPGLWFLPFAGTVGDPFFDGHDDWFVKHEDGTPYTVKWGGTCLDMTYAPARDHLRDVVRRITHQWGFQYLKIDGLWTGTGTPLEYVNTGYKEDGIGDAVFHDPNKSNIEAYRDGLKLVRAAAGKNVFILGCNGPQNMRSYGGAFGLVDGMRIGPDNKSDWKNLLRGPTFGSRHYFLNGRVWYNDPDPLYVRDSVPLNHAQLICSWVTISGALNTSSEWYPGLAPERLDLLKRTMPSHGLPARPVDLFDNDLPGIWLLTDDRHAVRRDVIGLFNWESKPKEFVYPLDKMGLDGKTEYAAFDYWKNSLVPAFKDTLRVTVPAESCCVLAVRPVANHPQLISTSRHITQGIVDVMEEKWDSAAKTLIGRSKIVGGDPYELRIVLPDKNWNAAAVEVSGSATAAFTQSDELVRATIQSANSGEVKWWVRFK
jgi:Melibiase